MQERALLAAAVLAGALAVFVAAPALAQEFRIEETGSVATVSPAALKPQTIYFTDHRQDELVDPKSGLIRFSDWAKAKPLEKQLLSLYPGYEEPTIKIGASGANSKTIKRRLHVYVAEARFELPRPPSAIDLPRYASLAFLERMDPAIKHRRIGPDEVTPNVDPKFAANKNPNRRWCDSPAATCIKSRYQFEGKLPIGIQLLNKLRDSGKQIAEHLEFEGELRVVPTAEIDQAAFARLTGVEAPVAAALEQAIVHVNQVMQFGKFLAILQPKPGHPNATVVTAFVALAVETDLFEKRKEFESVPVLRNMVPAQVLAGNSSFNTGNSISAGLPNYARNRIKALATTLARD